MDMKSKIKIIVLVILSSFLVACHDDEWTIYFDLNGGEGYVSPMKIEDGDEVIIETLPKGSGFTYGDYDFVGWSRDSIGYVIKENFTPHTDITLYAQWADNRNNNEPKTNEEEDNKTYIVTFDLNGANCEQPDSKSVAANDNLLYSYNLPSVWYPGFTLNGWSTTSYGEPINDYIVVTEDITLYAIWSQNIYKISFDLNGGSGTTPDDIEIAYGNYLYYYNLPDNTNFSYGNRFFKGWSETWYGTEPINNSLEIIGDRTLYAIWEDAYTIRFRINGGIGDTPDDMLVEKGTILYASDLPNNTSFSNAGYVFEGWSETSYGECLNSITINSYYTYLYAVWKKITADNVVNYIKNLPSGGTKTVSVSGNLTQDNLKDICSAIKRSNCGIELDLSSCTGLTDIGEDAFYNCSNLVKIVLPNTVKTIGKDAFECCYDLAEVQLSNSLETIGYQAFEQCSNLTSIQIPYSVKVIEEWAFYCCSKLDINIPYTVTAIGRFGLYNVKSITFGRQYNWYTTYYSYDWINKENGESVDILSEDTYQYNKYYYRN